MSIGAESLASLDETDGGSLLCIPPEAHTLRGFRRWVLDEAFPEKLRVMFLRGEVFLDMSKEEIRSHSSVKTEVGGVLWALNQEVDFGELFINGVLVTNVEADVSNNPDMVAVFWKSLEAGKVRYLGHRGRDLEIEGSPDWALEIVSDGSVFKDNRQLRDAYFRAGIREYWIIDARGADIEFQILTWRKDGYVAAPLKDGWLSSKIFKRAFRLSRERNRRGAWKYRLEMK